MPSVINRFLIGCSLVLWRASIAFHPKASGCQVDSRSKQMYKTTAMIFHSVRSDRARSSASAPYLNPDSCSNQQGREVATQGTREPLPLDVYSVSSVLCSLFVSLAFLPHPFHFPSLLSPLLRTGQLYCFYIHPLQQHSLSLTPFYHGQL